MRAVETLDDAVVAVTGLHRGESPQPGGAVVASLRRIAPGIRVVGLCYDPMESGIYSQGLDRLDAVHLIPYPKAGSKALMERLESVIAAERVDAIVPCLDTEIPNLIAIEADLADRGVRLCLPSFTAFEDRDKINLGGLCEQVGVPAPRTLQANDVATLLAQAAQIGYPCYVKGQLYGAHKVHSAIELSSAFAEIHNVWGGPVLVQEAIVGEEYNFLGLGDGKGGILGFCAIRKLMRTRLGKGFGGVVVEDPELEDKARRIIGALEWNGPFELEFLRRADGSHALFEMNPRFPSWADFPSQIGCNLPALLLERLLGLPETPAARCPAGRMFLRHCADLVADISDIARLGTHGVRDLAANATKDGGTSEIEAVK